MMWQHSFNFLSHYMMPDGTYPTTDDRWNDLNLSWGIQRRDKLNRIVSPHSSLAWNEGNEGGETRPACSWRPQGIQMVGSSTTYWPNSSGLAGRQAQVSCVNCQRDLLDLNDMLCLTSSAGPSCQANFLKPDELAHLYYVPHSWWKWIFTPTTTSYAMYVLYNSPTPFLGSINVPTARCVRNFYYFMSCARFLYSIL